MTKNIEELLDVLFKVSDQMTYTAYDRLYNKISQLNDILKKQEPKPVKKIDDTEVGIRSGFCPECQELIYYNILHPAKFCKYCGQAVKWDDNRDVVSKAKMYLHRTL